MKAFLDEMKHLLQEYPGFVDDQFLYVPKTNNFDPSVSSTLSTDSVGSSSPKRKRSGSDGVAENFRFRSLESIRTSCCTKSKKSAGSGGVIDQVDDHDLFKELIKLCFPLIHNPRNKEDAHLFVKAVGFFKKVRNKVGFEDYLALLDCFHDYTARKIPKVVGLKYKLADQFPDLMDDDFFRVLEFDRRSTQSSSKSGEEIIGENKLEIKKPSKSKGSMRMTPSYQKIPCKDIGRFHSSGIDEIGKEVLNFCCFSTTLICSKVKPIDPDEEKSNNLDDEMFEMDMLAAWIQSTMEGGKKLLKEIKEGKMYDINKYFSSYNFRVIEKMYDKNDVRGMEMENQLRLSPKATLPVLIERLEEMTCDVQEKRRAAYRRKEEENERRLLKQKQINGLGKNQLY